LYYCVELSVLCAFVTLNKRLLTYLLTYLAVVISTLLHGCQMSEWWYNYFALSSITSALSAQHSTAPSTLKRLQKYFRAVDFPRLGRGCMHGQHAWTTYRQTIRKLDRFRLNCLNVAYCMFDGKIGCQNWCSLALQHSRHWSSECVQIYRRADSGHVARTSVERGEFTSPKGHRSELMVRVRVSVSVTARVSTDWGSYFYFPNTRNVYFTVAKI